MISFSKRFLCVISVFTCAACAHFSSDPGAKKEGDSVQVRVADATGDKCADDDEHPLNQVSQIQYHNQVIQSYGHYFFTQIEPLELADFIREHKIQIVFDLRVNGSDKNLPSGFPAVYWHLGLALKTLKPETVKDLNDQLETFAEKSIIFISDDGDAAIAAFTNYWADEHTLNENWIKKQSAELGLKNDKWLAKWQKVMKSSESKRATASEAESQ